MNAHRAKIITAWAASLGIVALVVIAIVSLADHGLIG